jgi:hypothetical protein
LLDGVLVLRKGGKMRHHNSLRQLIALAMVLILLGGCGVPAPKPDETLVGTINMEEGAKSAQITLKVSNDGKSIETVGVMFTELKCKGFSAGSSSSTVSGRAPITDAKFVFKASNIGEVNGQFTSPTAANGTIHLAFFNGKTECGTWKWSATGK